MTFKQMLKEELSVKGATALVIEAVALVATLSVICGLLYLPMVLA